MHNLVKLYAVLAAMLVIGGLVVLVSASHSGVPATAAPAATVSAYPAIPTAPPFAHTTPDAVTPAPTAAVSFDAQLLDLFPGAQGACVVAAIHHRYTDGQLQTLLVTSAGQKEVTAAVATISTGACA